MPEEKHPPTLEELEQQGLLPWKPPGEPKEYGDTETLYGQVETFLRLHISLSDQRGYAVLAAWCLHTWQIPKWRATGPLYLLGPVSSGKTTVLECLEELAYRGVRGGSMSNSVMFRLSHAYQPTLLIDESQLYNREEYAETQAFLNERYRRGGRVWRMEGEGRNMIPRFFDAYGATAFAGSHPPWEALTSRSLLVKMEKGSPQRQTLTGEFYEMGKDLRAKLARWQGEFRQADPENPEFPDVAEEALKEKGSLSPRPSASSDPAGVLAERIKDFRVREIAYPLLAVAPGSARAVLLEYFEDLEKDHEAEDQASYLADYAQALETALKEGGKVSAQAVKVALAGIWGVLKEDKMPRSQTIMGALKTLGFRKTRVGRERLAGVLWDEPLMERLRVRFGTAPAAPATPAHEGENASPAGEKSGKSGQQRVDE